MLHRDGNYLAKITLTGASNAYRFYAVHNLMKSTWPWVPWCLPAGSEYVSTSCTGSPNLCDLTTGTVGKALAQKDCWQLT